MEWHGLNSLEPSCRPNAVVWLADRSVRYLRPIEPLVKRGNSQDTSTKAINLLTKERTGTCVANRNDNGNLRRGHGIRMGTVREEWGKRPWCRWRMELSHRKKMWTKYQLNV